MIWLYQITILQYQYKALAKTKSSWTNVSPHLPKLYYLFMIPLKKAVIGLGK